VPPSGFSWKHIEHQIRRDGFRPLIIAHRGSSASAPENTLAAFSLALEQGVDAIECDVRLTKDNHLVVIHDATLNRTTNGTGYVRDHTREELDALDAGSWFHRRFAGERIPTLDTVLSLVDGKKGVNVEIKPVESSAAAHAIVEQCLTLVRKFHAHRHVLLTSFQHSLLRLARRYDPAVNIGLLYHPVHHIGKSPIRLARQHDACVFVCSVRFLRRGVVADAHRSTIAVAAYTVNTRSQLQRCLRLGVEGIVTNVPEDILTLLQSES